MDVSAYPKKLKWWVAVGGIALAGLIVRVAAAQGGLWTDEAWSMTYAIEAGDPVGVFLRINHDNNHHLISLWLQALGDRAPPLLARVPAILAGTGSIVLAALLVGRTSRAGGMFAAVLFAFSPILVTYGSEARGYALMVLAALAMLLIADFPRPSPRHRWYMALATLAGMLSHLTMIAPVVLVTLWVYVERRRADGSAHAARSTLRLMGPAIMVAAAALILVFGAAAASPLGMRVGGYSPFVWADYRRALADLSGWTFGLSAVPDWLRLSLIVIAAALAAFRLGDRGRLFAILILGVPIVAAVIQPGNIQFARYFLCSATGLLLLSAEALGRLFGGKATGRVAALAIAVAVSMLMLRQDMEIVETRRGQPERIVAALRQVSPQGARLAVQLPRLEAVARLAAQRQGYPIGLTPDCADADFLLSGPGAPLPADCAGSMVPLAQGRAGGISGDDWTLYGRKRSGLSPDRPDQG